MVYEIVWTRQAEIRFLEVSEYLISEWSFKELQDFYFALEKNLDALVAYPYSFRISSGNANREALITRHNLLVYKVENNQIILLTIWDTRMNPQKRKY